jgi:hypothetical protein
VTTLADAGVVAIHEALNDDAGVYGAVNTDFAGAVVWAVPWPGFWIGGSFSRVDAGIGRDGEYRALFTGIPSTEAICTSRAAGTVSGDDCAGGADRSSKETSFIA